MAQAARVLPSNAPPLRDTHEASRAVLQEHSANRQQIYHHHHYPALNVYEQHKLASTGLPTENAYAVRPPVPNVYYSAHPAYFRQSYHQRHADTDHEGRLRVEKQWRTLYDRFLQCPKYKDYRSRQHKDDKTGQDQKWPEPLERAFFKALLYWPPMGRRKHMHKEKQRGRNELIADYIKDCTGVSRSRKQVSSHIQVLKPLVEQDKQIMKWLSDKDDHELAGDSARRFGGYHPSYTTGRIRSTYPASAQAMQVEHTDYRLPSRNDIRMAKPHFSIFEPVEFKLFVQPSSDPERRGLDDIEPLHIYSCSTSQPVLPDQHITSWDSLQQEFPVLASMHAVRPVDCNVLAVEASLAMPTQSWRDSKNIELAVILNCISRQLLQNCKLRCVNRFYKGGQALPPNATDGSGDVQLTMSDGGDKSETRLKFGSAFWANTLNPTSTLAKSIMAAAHAEPDERSRIRQSVDADMQSITAVQEIAVPTLSGLETILIMHWSFRLSNSDCGSTIWHRIHLPAPMTHMKSEASSTTTLAVDTPFDFNAPIDLSVCTAGAQQGYPALQSPFEYDSGSASDTSPSTWPTTVSATSSHMHHGGDNMENSFDFSTQGMMGFDAAMVIDGFDTTAFNFDVNADYEFTAPDPNAVDVQLYAQKWANATVNGGYGASFDGKQWQDYSTHSAYASYPQSAVSQHAETFAGYDGSQKAYEAQLYAASAADAQQAYAGAVKAEQLASETWSATMVPGRC